MEDGGHLGRTLRSQADCNTVLSGRAHLSIDGVTMLPAREMGFTHSADLEQNI